MIKELANKDERIVKAYLNKRPYFSLFLVADIDKYGFESEVFNIWADYENSEINYVIGKYYDTLLIYSNENKVDIQAVYKFLKHNNINFKVLILSSDIFDNCVEKNDFSHIHRNYYCELTKENFEPICSSADVYIAEQRHSSEILLLFNSMEEFEGLDMTEEAIKSYIEDGSVYLIMEEDEIASVAMCTAKTDILASIGVVFTNKKYRGKGYASTVVSELSKNILKQGFRCCLSYDNPEAGSIYMKIGYKEVGDIIIAIK